MEKTRDENTYTAFEGRKRLAQGDLSQVISKVKKRIGDSAHSSVLIFSDSTGRTMDFNFQGSMEDVRKRLEIFTTATEVAPSTGPGRPRLGVVCREVSLLPRHWEWLATQPRGASATLRTLVEEARKKSGGETSVRKAQERTYQAMSILAGDLVGYEEALRALYKRDEDAFLSHTKSWVKDVHAYIHELAAPVFK